MGSRAVWELRLRLREALLMGENLIFSREHGVYGSDVRQLCPFCGHYNNSATEMTGRGKPEAGDISLCIECVQFSIFTGEGLDVRKPSFLEDVMIEDSAELRLIQSQLLASKR